MDLLQHNPELVVSGLLAALVEDDEILRTSGAVHLRRCLDTLGESEETHVWPRLGEGVRLQVRADALAALEAETSPHIRRRLSYLVVQVTKTGSQFGEGWDELLPTVLRLLQDEGNPGARESSLDVLQKLFEFMPEEMREETDSTIPLVAEMMGDAELAVTVAAAKAALQVIFITTAPAEHDGLLALMEPILGVLSSAFDNFDEYGAYEIIMKLTAVTGRHASFVEPFLEGMVRMMMDIAREADLQATTRDAALGVVTELAEEGSTLFRSRPDLVHDALQLALNFCADLDDDEEWALRPDPPAGTLETVDDDLGMYNSGEHAVDKLCRGLGTPLYDDLKPQLYAMAEDESWQVRHAALTALTLACEGLRISIAQDAEAVLNFVLPLLGDEHVRVRYMAVHCMGQLASDLGPVMNFAAAFHPIFIPPLLGLASTAEVPRLHAHALGALGYFCSPSECPPEAILSHEEALMAELQSSVVHESYDVQRAALPLLGTIAVVIGEAFEPYYDDFAELARGILMLEGTEEEAPGLPEVRGRAAESLSLMGQGVGKERFLPLALELLPMLAPMGGFLGDDMEARLMVEAVTRIARTVEEHFVPFLDVVIPSLLKSVAFQPVILLEDADEEHSRLGEDGMEVQEMEVHGHGVMRVGMNTFEFMRKNECTHMVYQYVKAMGPLYIDYVAQTYAAIEPTLEGTVARASLIPTMALVPVLMYAAARAGQPDLAQSVLDQAMPRMLKSYLRETTIEVSLMCGESIAEAARMARLEEMPGLHSETLEMVVVMLMNKLVAVADAWMKRNEKASMDHHFDEAALEAMEFNDGADEEILASAVDAIGQAGKGNPDEFLPLYNTHLADLAMQFASEDNPPGIRNAGLCIMIDCVEGCSVADTIPALMPLLMDGTMEENEMLRHASLYGLGVCATVGGEAFAPFAEAALARLQEAVASDPTDIEKTVENAASALLKFAVHSPEFCDSLAVYRQAVQMMPLTFDTFESQTMNTLLTSVINSDHPLAGEALDAVFPVVCQLVCQAPVDEEDMSGIITHEAHAMAHGWLESLAERIGEEALGELVSALDPEMQAMFG
eukprot:PLAT11316.1.p1 GENE.PLAT11316.1~~PLAT11316.1.p1  ORF type:complete len:1106 (-),score=572.92 PLAT11316.1:653-3880(-)